MRCTIDGCRNFRECLASVVLSFIDIVPHHLLDGTDSAFHLSIYLVMVLSGHSDLNAEGLHDLLKKASSKWGVLVHDNVERVAMDIEDVFL